MCCPSSPTPSAARRKAAAGSTGRRTADGTWEALSDGLPGASAYLTVLRDAFDVASEPPYPLVFGSKSGHVFASVDGGDSWRLVASFLPPVLCVRVLD